MDKLAELANSLNEDEQKLFRKYHSHKSKSQDRKDMRVFSKVCKKGKYDAEEVVKAIYGKYNNTTSRAHNLLRFRIKESIQDFISQQVHKDDVPMYINKLITIARFLYFRKKHMLSWRYLEDAEKTAIKTEEYELLNQVYQYMIEYAWVQPPEVLEEVILKERENQKAAQEARSMNLALSVINNQLNIYHNKGINPDIDSICQDALMKFGVQTAVSQKASHLHKMAMIVKMNLEAKKEYDKLYKYIIGIIQKMQDAKLFNKYNYKYRIELQNIVSYAAVRAGDYDTSLKYIKIIEEENKIYPETDLLSIRSFMVKVACLSSTGKVQEAVEVLKYLKVKYKKLYQYDDEFFGQLNCNTAAIHLHIGNIEVSIKCIREILNHSKRIVRFYGLEMLFYCYATECFLAVEKGDMEYASSRIKSTERKFKELLQQKRYARNNAFLRLLRYLINNNNAWGQNEFKRKAWEFIKMQPSYKHGIEFISFNAWVYAKLHRKNYSERDYQLFEEKLLSDVQTA